MVIYMVHYSFNFVLYVYVLPLRDGFMHNFCDQIPPPNAHDPQDGKKTGGEAVVVTFVGAAHVKWF